MDVLPPVFIPHPGFSLWSMTLLLVLSCKLFVKRRRSWVSGGCLLCCPRPCLSVENDTVVSSRLLGR